MSKHVQFSRLQPTYEGLKRGPIFRVGKHFNRLQPTYEGLKLPSRMLPWQDVLRLQPTYEGLKLRCSRFASVRIVPFAAYL